MAATTSVEFHGQVAIVTGAGRGLGRAYAQLLARRGCKVVVNDLAPALSGSPAQAVVDEIRAGGGTAQADLHDVAARPEAIVRSALDAFGRIDIVINNAGVTGGGRIDEMPAADFDRLLDVNLRGAVGVLRAAWPHFVKQGYGRVVNTSSGSVLGLPGCFAYQTSKAALIGLTRALALDGAPHGIKVNAINPIAYTRMTADIPDPAFRNFLETHFQPALAAPFVVALVCRDLPCSGELFSVGGGIAARVTLGYVPGRVLGADATPEDWLAQFDGVLATEGLRVAPHAMDEVAYRAQQIGAVLANANGAATDWSRPVHPPSGDPH
ncbi:MAG TPA: SDR family NAD(P)-dependent oxidoreductase [Burkholderiaceae bacterium]|nr:SDR family NAD(P)-dependent oxidoreductase [Burkholderiaceae bacterium]